MAPDLVTLSWCLGEIRESLAQADRLICRQLESGADDASPLRAARASIHQAHGALAVVAIDGVPLLTQQAERLLESIDSGDAMLTGETVSGLQRAFQAVVEHCEELLRGAPNQPLHLFPYYRDLLRARRAERVNPADLYFPRLPASLPVPDEPLADLDARALAAVRAEFERGLLRLMRDPSGRAGSQEMRGAVEAVCGSRATSANRAFWWVTRAYFEALAAGRLTVDVEIKRLLARFNLQLRNTLREGAPVADRLFKDMLFALASIADPTPIAHSVRTAFSLEGSVPEDLEARRYGRLDERVLRAAREALARARTAFDKVGRGSVAELPNFAHGIDDFCDAAEQIPAEGLRALGRAFAQVRRLLTTQAAAPDDALSLEIAAAILFAEQALEQGARPGSDYDLHGRTMAERLSTALAGDSVDEVPEWLRSLSQAAQERLTMAAFVGETGNNLRAVEKSLDAFFRDPERREGLPETVRALQQVAGALRLLGHQDAAVGAAAVAQRVAAFADSDDAPDPGHCDRVAASIGAIGFFVEGLLHPERAVGRFELDEQTGEFSADFGRPAIEPIEPHDDLRSTDEASAPARQSAREGAQRSAESALAASAQQAASLYLALRNAPEDPALRGELQRTMLRVRDALTLIDDAGRRAAADDAVAQLDGAAPPGLGPLADALAAAGVPVAQDADAAPALPEDEATIDSELLGIFLSEAAEVLAAISSNAANSREGPADPQYLTTIRRGFHTLKGSSRMVGLGEFGEAAWSMEQVLNLWLAEERTGTDALYSLIADAHAQMGAWIALMAGDARAARSIDPRSLVSAAASLREAGAAAAPQRSMPEPLAQLAESADDATAPGDSVTSETAQATAMIDPVVAHGAVRAQGAPDAESAGGSPDSEFAADAQDTIVIGGNAISRPLYLIFLAEADELIGTLCDDAIDWRERPQRGASERGLRAAHSLAGSASVVTLDPVHVLAARLEAFMQAQRTLGDTPDAEDLRVVAETADRIRQMLHQFAGGSLPREDADAARAIDALAARWSAGVKAARDAASAPVDAQAIDAESPAFDLLEAETIEIQPLEETPDAAFEAEDAGGAERAEIGAAIDAAFDELLADAAGACEPVEDAAGGEIRIEALADWVDTQPAELGAQAAELGAQAATVAARPIAVPLPPDELDDELLPVFVVEAEDYLPQIGENLRRWLAHPGDESLPQTLMRHLHTVKGGARMAGAMGLGQLLHEIEDRVESLAGLPSVPTPMIDELIAEHDRVVAMFEAIRDPSSAPPAGRGPQMANARSAPADGDGERSPAAFAADADAAPATADSGGQARAHPLVRVRADLLDRLVNEAGEVSIARSRLDNELGGLRQSLGELTENVNRLRSQLREIEIQAETQIQARIAQQKEHERAFDPLEFDRYTRFQELTRMLAESVNDVATVQQNATRSLEEASQDLHRQGQVLRDLQQDLMRVRMVQFGSISDRLYRVVRQAGKELDKRVHLDIRGAGVEVDRGVLEKMAGPIEHLLRNAVAHGIEPRALRAGRGKPETGEIAVEVRQEGREIVLSFSDDGGGLDFERIRARGIAAGLLSPEAKPGERELADLIFAPGFTTAHSVTELAGRGVGMDVVRAEVAALGGRIETDTTPGEGTRFTIVLPLTLAVAQVVLASAGRARFAVPSSSVEQVLHVRPQELAAAYERRHVEWQGAQVPLFYLGSLVELDDLTPTAQHQSPVLILRSGNQRIAMHCDDASREQEVVVKGVGPQVARVKGIAGATVLGNGDIVLIVNPVTLAQGAGGEALDRAIDSPRIPAMLAQALPAVVMVVDDSLTVRKVTQRLLAREGYQVLLARDGVDALRQLQDTVPDVMLVDIEMPRMDGFDLTRNVRSDPRLSQVPIVMITSRTADKHRNYALSLGVNAYLGKPYDEQQLLELVAAHAGNRRPAAVAL